VGEVVFGGIEDTVKRAAEVLNVRVKVVSGVTTFGD
jgi:hypothetical protein